MPLQLRAVKVLTLSKRRPNRHHLSLHAREKMIKEDQMAIPSNPVRTESV